jgi:hypothetical protein
MGGPTGLNYILRNKTHVYVMHHAWESGDVPDAWRGAGLTFCPGGRGW